MIGADDLIESDDTDTEESSEGLFDGVTLFAGKFREALEGLPPFLRHISEDDLYEEATPTPTDWKLRNRYADLIKHARLSDEKLIPTVKVFDEIMSRMYFYEKILANPKKLAFMIRPLVEHTDFYMAIQQEALKKIFYYVKTNEVDAKNLPQFLKIAEKAIDRTHGAVAQKMQIQSKNLNVDVTAQAQLQGSQGAEDVQNRITALQTKLLDSGVRDVADTSEDPS